MKKFTILLFFVFITILMSFPLNSFAADTTRMSLPEGAKARLGKGSIRQIAYSPNGMHLAAAGSAGIWIYDVTIHREVAMTAGASWCGMLKQANASKPCQPNKSGSVV